MNHKSRTLLFGTPLISRQMRRYIESHLQVTTKQLRQDFSDIQSNTIYKTLAQLEQAGRIEREGSIVRITDAAYTEPSAQADRAWKGAQILKVFTRERLALISDVSVNYISLLCNRWCTQELIQELPAKEQPLYQVLVQSAVRPLAQKFSAPQKQVKRKSSSKPKQQRRKEMTRNDMLALIHIQKAKALSCTQCQQLYFGKNCPGCGSDDAKPLDDWRYREILKAIGGSDSCTRIEDKYLKVIIEFFNDAGYQKAHPFTSPAPNSPAWQKSAVIAQIKKRAPKVLGPTWENRLAGFLTIMKKTNLKACDEKELRKVIGWINRTEKYRSKKNGTGN